MGISVNDISGILKGNSQLLDLNPDLKAILPEAKAPRKYRNEPEVFQGITFDSGREAKRAAELTLAMKAGEIICLAYHVRFLISPEGCKPVYYEADFVYLTKDLKPVVEDVKSLPTKTHVYKLKKKLFEAKYHITIKEV